MNFSKPLNVSSIEISQTNNFSTSIVTFTFTNTLSIFTIPSNVCLINIQAKGGNGSTISPTSNGGFGGGGGGGENGGGGGYSGGCGGGVSSGAPGGGGGGGGSFISSIYATQVNITGIPQTPPSISIASNPPYNGQVVFTLYYLLPPTINTYTFTFS